MIRLFFSVLVRLIADAIGLIVAALVLDDMSLDASGFLMDVAIFTAVDVISQPLIIKMAFKHSDALLGSTALLSSLVALIVANWFSDGMSINGATTWLLATMIVWAAGLVATLILPLVVFKKWLRPDPNAGRRGPPPMG